MRIVEPFEGGADFFRRRRGGAQGLDQTGRHARTTKLVSELNRFDRHFGRAVNGLPVGIHAVLVPAQYLLPRRALTFEAVLASKKIAAQGHVLGNGSGHEVVPAPAFDGPPIAAIRAIEDAEPAQVRPREPMGDAVQLELEETFVIHLQEALAAFVIGGKGGAIGGDERLRALEGLGIQYPGSFRSVLGHAQARQTQELPKRVRRWIEPAFPFGSMVLF